MDLDLLQVELAAASIVVDALGLFGDQVFTYDDDGAVLDLPPEAQPVVDAHVAPPPITEVVGLASAEARLGTTDATAHEIFRFPCDLQRLYTAPLTILGVDAGNFASKSMEGRFTWKRVAGGAVMVGIAVISDVRDTAAASWAPNA